jgi:hypothetical protein
MVPCYCYMTTSSMILLQYGFATHGDSCAYASSHWIRGESDPCMFLDWQRWWSQVERSLACREPIRDSPSRKHTLLRLYTHLHNRSLAWHHLLVVRQLSLSIDENAVLPRLASPAWPSNLATLHGGSRQEAMEDLCARWSSVGYYVFAPIRDC